MPRQFSMPAIAIVGTLACCCLLGGASAFVAVRQASVGANSGAVSTHGSSRFLAANEVPDSSSWSLNMGMVVAAAGLCAMTASAARSHKSASTKATLVGLKPVSLDACETFRDQLIACRASSSGDVPSVKETDDHMNQLETFAKQVLAGSSAAAVVFSGSFADTADAYPIFAQQNYKNPREANGKIVCANCHLAGKGIDVRLPNEVLPDTIFKIKMEIPLKYEKRVQPIADGSKASLNVGAIAIMPEGWKLAPKDRLPKVIKKEMKGLAWAPYSKDKPNIVVAGPVPGKTYAENMVLPVLAPTPDNKDIYFEKVTMYFGGNRGRGQVYPEGNQSNNNQFNAAKSGVIKSITGDATKTVVITQADGTESTQEVLPGAQFVVEVGEKVAEGDPLTTNPNVGGFGQEEKEVVLQDVNRIYAYCALATSIFIAQLSFVLKKKQFEKVQLAEGF
jgi:apocytochrome f